ncbi:MAG: Hint domain-containing protein [Clostridium sp.]
MNTKLGKAQEMFLVNAVITPNSKNGHISVMASLPEASACMTIKTEVREKATGQLLAGNMWIIREDYNFKEDIVLPTDVLKKELEVTTHYQWVYNGLLCSNDGTVEIREHTDLCIVQLNDTLIKNITVDAPVSKNGNQKVIMYYNRKGGDYCYNYNFLENHRTEVFLPFSGAIECTYPIVSMELKTACLKYGNNGSLYFDGKDKIIWKKNGKICWWAFPEDWENTFDESKITTNSTLYLYATFSVILQTPISRETVEININSCDTPIPYTGGIVKNIYPIQLQWGCFAPDTYIRMADGIQLRIDMIKTGDRIRAMSGENVLVMSVITGMEEKITILVTAEGHRIRLTSNHPVETERGILPADMLNAADKIKTENGTYAKIDELFEEDYRDKVYNLMLEKESLLSANNLSMGDFSYQQKNYLPVADRIFLEEEHLLGSKLEEEYERWKNSIK